MSKIKAKAQPPERNNPFLTERTKEIWKRLDENGKPVSKEELLKRVKIIKAQGRLVSRG